jgi:hypothetical protein
MANPITPAAASNDPNAVHASTAATGPAARIASQSTPPSKLATTSGAATSLPKDTVQISTAAQKALEEAQQTQAQAAKQASQHETQAQSPKPTEAKPQ